MSIIHEALKKVQSSQSENKTLKDPTATSSVHSELTPVSNIKVVAPSVKNPPTVITLALWSILIVGVCGFTFYNLYELKNRKSEMAATPYSPTLAQTPLTQTTVVATQLPLIEQAPVVAPVKIKKGEILLSGIVIMDGKNFALVNKEFYEVGEKVEGATITKITSDSIEILQKGKTRTIKVIRPE
jgi:type II secretory pathway component PulC